MQQVGGSEDGGEQPETRCVDATVLEHVSQSDAYRNRLIRELAGP
jgi:hypothetical protein